MTEEQFKVEENISKAGQELKSEKDIQAAESQVQTGLKDQDNPAVTLDEEKEVTANGVSQDGDQLAASEGGQDLSQAKDTVSEPSQVLAGVSNDDFNHLTRKNQQFMMNIDKRLSQDLHHQVRGDVYQEMVATLLEGQESGQTARHIYGTPTEVVQSVLAKNLEPSDPNQKEGRSSDGLLVLDGGLLLGSVFTVLTGISMMRVGESNQGIYMGLLTLIINYIVAGYAMMMTAKHLPNPNGPKGKKGYGKYFLVSISSMLVWFAAISLSGNLLPQSLNPILPPALYIMIGGFTFALRFYLKKKLNIRGTVF